MNDDYQVISNSVINEIEFEKYFYKLEGLDPSDFGYLPKISNLKNLFPCWLLAMVGRFFYILFPVIVFSYSFTKLIKYLYFKFFRLTNVVDLNFCDTLLFSSSDSALKIARKVFNSKLIVLSRPTKVIAKSDHDTIFLDSLSLLRSTHLLTIFCKSIYYSLVYIFTHEGKSWRYISLFFFEFLVVKHAMIEIASHKKMELFTVDHFDRWAVLVDSLAVHDFTSLSVVQHGLLTSSSNGSIGFLIPRKLENIDTIYYFDEASKIVFLDDVLSQESRPVFVCYNNSISPVPVVNGNVVLIIGHSVCLEFHCNIISSLIENIPENFAILYKPHPTQKLSGLVMQQRWSVITDPDLYPCADLVVSYPSSLAFQYRSLRTPLVEHDLNCDISSALSVINEINTAIRMMK